MRAEMNGIKKNNTGRPERTQKKTRDYEQLHCNLIEI